MKKRNEFWTAAICILLMLSATFIVGMRAGQHDRIVVLEEEMAEKSAQYEAEIAALERELEAEKQIEHVLVTYEYKPLPVDYENIGNIMPEDSDAVIIAKTLWGEYRADDYDQRSAVVWNILNRYDAGYGTIRDICTTGQYHGYNANNPVDADLYDTVIDVMLRHEIETLGVNTDVGRTLPGGFLWFEGNGTKNTFRNAYIGGEHITP